MGYQLIETVIVGSGGAASIEFTGIPQDGVDLQILVSARTTATDYGMLVRFNGDTTNVTSAVLRGEGSSADSTTFNGLNGAMSKSDQTANTFGNASVYISNYTSGAAKSFSADGVNENNATAANQVLSANSWSGTSAITSVTISNPSGNLAQYSTASLYKIL
jgi:hypothetical protein